MRQQADEIRLAQLEAMVARFTVQVVGDEEEVALDGEQIVAQAAERAQALVSAEPEDGHELIFHLDGRGDEGMEVWMAGRRQRRVEVQVVAQFGRQLTQQIFGQAVRAGAIDNPQGGFGEEREADRVAIQQRLRSAQDDADGLLGMWLLRDSLQQVTHGQLQVAI